MRWGQSGKEGVDAAIPTALPLSTEVGESLAARVNCSAVTSKPTDFWGITDRNFGKIVSLFMDKVGIFKQTSPNGLNRTHKER